MTIEHQNPNWPGSTYADFNGAARGGRAPQSSKAAPSQGRRWVLAGVATAVAAGMALGIAVQPKPVSAAKAEAQATPLLVELAPPESILAAPPSDRLDVRPAVAAPRAMAAPARPAASRSRDRPQLDFERAPFEIEQDLPVEGPDEPAIYEETDVYGDGQPEPADEY